MTSESLPTWFDWLANIVVPLLLGVATLVVAIAALRASRNSTELARSIDEAQKDAAERDERRRLAEMIFEWSARRWLEDPPSTVRDKAALSAAKSIFSVALRESSLPGTGALQEALWLLDRAPKELGLVGYSYFSGAMSATVEGLVARWLRDPTDDAALNTFAHEQRSSALDGALAEDRKYRSEGVPRPSQKAAAD